MKYKLFRIWNFFLLSLFSIISLNIYAQKQPIKYGKIDIADLKMKYYSLDTSAAAVILCDYGYFNATRIEYSRTIRIKVLKKEGTSWGNHVFPTFQGTRIKGSTFNLDNGQITESKLKSESIFEERVTKSRFRSRIAMPNVKEGSIIEIEFVMPGGIPYEWKFQENIPVRWSELVIEELPFNVFSKNLSGFEPLTENSDTRWVAKNMPAFKKEPYMNDMANYITKLNIEYKGYYTSGWESINSLLMKYEYFGLALDGSMYLNRIAEEIENKYNNNYDKLKAAHEAVKKVKWNEISSLFASEIPLSIPYNKKIGNSAEINMILIQLLRKLNFETMPLALSTRDNGFLPVTTPTIDAFNYLVAYTKIGDKMMILDATEELLPIWILPSRCMNLRGRILDGNLGYWVDIEPNKKDKKTIRYDLKLLQDNQLTGTLKYNRSEYAAFDFRKEYEKYSDREEFIKNFEKMHNNLMVISYDIKNLDSIYFPLEEEYQVKIKNMVNTTGNMLIINPMMFERMTENPFKIENRKYPIDFIYPQEIKYLFKLTLPKELKIVELPKSLLIKIPDNSASCMYKIEKIENTINLTYLFSINKPIFDEKEYLDVRLFFDAVVKKHAEPIVLVTE